ALDIELSQRSSGANSSGSTGDEWSSLRNAAESRSVLEDVTGFCKIVRLEIVDTEEYVAEVQQKLKQGGSNGEPDEDGQIVTQENLDLNREQLETLHTQLLELEAVRSREELARWQRKYKR